MKLSGYVALAVMGTLLVACGEGKNKASTDGAGVESSQSLDGTATPSFNPLLAERTGPYGVPDFSAIKDEHYRPAVDQGIAELKAEIDAIRNNPDAPSFDNTILALEKAGGSLNASVPVFSNNVSTNTNDTLNKLRGEIYPELTREFNAIQFDDVIWQKVQAVYAMRETLDLDEQDARLLELTHKSFLRAGAALPKEVKDEIAEINARLSELSSKYAENLLKSTKAFEIVVTHRDELSGLSQDFLDAIKIDGKDAWRLTVDRAVYETFMSSADNRDLRAKMFDGYRLRANSGEFDNGPIAIETAQLRAKRAELMGYDSHAHFILEDNMAKTPEGVENFLLQVWEPGLARAKEERADMQAMIGDAFTFAGHDWWYYSEKVRQERFAIDSNLTKPYFEFDSVLKGAFDASSKLLDISFTEVDVQGWNDVTRSFDVKGPNGEHLGLFMIDMYARDSKRGGAWMNSLRDSSNIEGNSIRPIITNNLNLIQPPEGQPTLMPFGEVETLFHELGHALHGLLTQIKYTTFSGVDGPRDYTEFPAQMLEHWAGSPEVLAEYAKHYETGEVIPQDLLTKLRAAANHNQGFRTTEFIAASLLDLAWHTLSHEEAMKITDARAFEKEVLDGYGLLPEIEPRYRSQYFSHIFAGGYSSGYYAYLWSEILDADGFQAFLDAGDIYDPDLSARLKKWVYEAGGLKPADELYRLFRGKDPEIGPLLKMRGFD